MIAFVCSITSSINAQWQLIVKLHFENITLRIDLADTTISSVCKG